MIKAIDVLTLILRPNLSCASHTESSSSAQRPIDDGVLKVKGNVVKMSEAPEASSHPRDIVKTSRSRSKVHMAEEGNHLTTMVEDLVGLEDAETEKIERRSLRKKTSSLRLPPAFCQSSL
eukprot:3574887-Amphidinium_carterae.2